MSVLLPCTTAVVRRRTVLDALQDGVTSGVYDTAIKTAIAALRTNNYDISKFLGDCDRVKAEVRAHTPERALAVWTEVDSVIAKAMRATSYVNEIVLENCARCYAALGTAGQVIFANDSFSAFVPNIVGQKLEALFPGNAEIVRGALENPERSGPFRLEMETKQGRIPVNAEFGPVRLDDDSVMRYALIGDIRPYVEAETASFQATPIGILRVDRKHCVQFINAAGCETLGRSEGFEGTPVRHLFVDSEERRFTSSLEATFAAAKGFAGNFQVTRPERDAIPVRLFAVPEHDPQRSVTGVLIFFRSLQMEYARDEIHRACEKYSAPEDMLRELFSILQRIVPFDLASFGMYAEGMRYFRTLLAEPQCVISGATPWLEIPPEMTSWVMGEKTWEEDIDAFFARYPSGAALFRHPFVKGIMAEGYRSFISLPVRQRNGVSTVLSLTSKKPRQYGAKEFALLRELPVEQVLRMAEEGFDQRQREFVHETMKLLAEASSHHELARVVINQFSKTFGWDHVSVFKVNRVDKCFELVEQVDRTGGSFTFQADYTQPLNSGMLGEALATGAPVKLDDAHARPASRPYVPVSGKAESALCVPILLDGTVSWILNVETAMTGAFHGPDVDSVQSVLTELSRVLEKSFQAQLTQDVLDLTDQGVVIVDACGRIRDANLAAEQLLGGLRRDLKGKAFVDFAAEEDRDIFAEKRSSAERHVQIKDLTGELRPAIVSLRHPIDGYDHKIWLLTDTVQRDWNVELRYLRETVHDVAQQTRVPLMLASNLIRRGARLVGEANPRSQAGEIFEKAVRQLDKADITYERLVVSLTDRRGSADERVRTDVADCLKGVVSELPIDDQQEIIIKTPAYLKPVLANRSALEFVFRSAIFYLLRKKPMRPKIKVRLSSSKSDVRVRIFTRGMRDDCAASRPDDRITAYETEARMTAALAPDALASVVAAQGGHIRLPTAGANAGYFDISFPVDAPEQRIAT